MTHVLITRLDSEGDVLLAGPAIRAVAARAQRVTLVCSPRGRQAAAMLPGVDEVLVWDAPWIAPEPDPVDPAHIDGFVARVRELAPDEAIILGSFHQSPLPTALLLRLARVPRVGATSVDYPGSLLDVRHRISDDVHEVERSLDLARTMGYPLPDGDGGELRVLRPGGVPPVEPPYVAVHPGASVPARAWAPERMRELVERLPGTVLVTGGPAERDLTRYVAGTRGIDLGGATSFAGLADILAHAECVVVGNTGPAHLAAAVGTPVVSPYALTVPAVRWRPWAVPHALLSVDVPCKNCRARNCPVPGHPCVDDVAIDDVLDAVAGLSHRQRPLVGVQR